jgi:simple sugar transport system permease protein
MYLAALVVFGAFTALRHANPFAMYHAMWEATVMNAYGRGQVLDKAAPFILTGLAVAIPARAGLVNIGGEGQIVIGVTGAGGVALALGTHVTGTPALILMGLGAMVAGAAWAAIATVLRLVGNVNEAIATLLLNYVGADVLNYLVYGPWRDPAGNGQPAARPIPTADTLPSLGSYAHIGIVLALIAAAAVAFALKRTSWGFMLRCVGGNKVAARRAGLKVAWLMLSAMLVGGALAGLAGMIQFTGLEGQLRPGIAATFGYTGFLASWLARHQPGKVVLAATLLAGIAVAGDSLQITSHLPGSTVNILMALILLAMLATRGRSKAAA